MSKMSTYGLIPTDVICRFGELTKTEIIVLSYLYSRRNKNSGQCNPKRTDICEAVQIHKSHVSTALKNLEDKGWAIEDDQTKNFILAVPDFKGRPKLPFSQQKVTESATTELPNPQLKVTKSVTEVTDSATKSYENGNSLNKDLNKQGTDKEQTTEHSGSVRDKQEITSMDAEELGYPYTDLFTAFPDLVLYPGQLGLIDNEIKNAPVDREALRLTIAKYVGNRNGSSYNPSKIGTFLSVFRDEKQRLEKNGKSQRNGYGNKRTDADVIAESADFYANYDGPVS